MSAKTRKVERKKKLFVAHRLLTTAEIKLPLWCGTTEKYPYEQLETRNKQKNKTNAMLLRITV